MIINNFSLQQVLSLVLWVKKVCVKLAKVISGPGCAGSELVPVIGFFYLTASQQIDFTSIVVSE